MRDMFGPGSFTSVGPVLVAWSMAEMLGVGELWTAARRPLRDFGESGRAKACARCLSRHEIVVPTGRPQV